jgi:hypothetical protein
MPAIDGQMLPFNAASLGAALLFAGLGALLCMHTRRAGNSNRLWMMEGTKHPSNSNRPCTKHPSNCAICLEEMEGKIAEAGGCGHCFHYWCIADFQRHEFKAASEAARRSPHNPQTIKNTCPLCRAPLPCSADILLDQADYLLNRWQAESSNCAELRDLDPSESAFERACLAEQLISDAKGMLAHESKSRPTDHHLFIERMSRQACQQGSGIQQI